MGSLCCVAARPHGASSTSRDWSIANNDPFWSTNASFSPPLSRRWEGITVNSLNFVSSFSSSGSSSSGSSSPEGGFENLTYFSSPEGGFENLMQGADLEEYVRVPSSEPLLLSSSFLEGNNRGYISSPSDNSTSSEHELITKLPQFAPGNLPNPLNPTKCSVCQRLLTKKSPWGPRKIVYSADMPVAGVLPCCHVYHAECLERTTPKSRKNDPPCPVCENLLERDGNTEQWAICRLKNGFPRLRSVGEGPSRVWSECVVGTTEQVTKPGSDVVVFGRSCLKRHLSLNGNLSPEPVSAIN